MAHIMLPTSLPDDYPDKPARFADVGVPELINSMEKLGAERSRLVAAVAGGASVRCEREHFEIGRRNAEAVVKQLENLGIRCVAHDLGGTFGRTVTMSTESGNIVVNTVAGEDMLCSLRSH
jgi:chemotaxis protein CheD